MLAAMEPFGLGLLAPPSPVDAASPIDALRGHATNPLAWP